jgi:hypothetical protein
MQLRIAGFGIAGYFGVMVKEEGQGNSDAAYHYLHLHFDISYLDNTVMDVKLSTPARDALDISDYANHALLFYRYSVSWRLFEPPHGLDDDDDDAGMHIMPPQELEVRMTPVYPQAASALAGSF